jgi:hypothetical protein
MGQARGQEWQGFGAWEGTFRFPVSQHKGNGKPKEEFFLDHEGGFAKARLGAGEICSVSVGQIVTHWTSRSGYAAAHLFSGAPPESACFFPCMRLI